MQCIHNALETSVLSPLSLSSTVEDVNRPLIVEIHKASFLSRKLLGLATIPLYNVRHSNKVGVHGSIQSLLQ